jgi:hypothetical protein
MSEVFNQVILPNYKHQTKKNDQKQLHYYIYDDLNFEMNRGHATISSSLIFTEDAVNN